MHFSHAPSHQHLRNACIFSLAYKGLRIFLSSLNKTSLIPIELLRTVKTADGVYRKQFR